MSYLMLPDDDQRTLAAVERYLTDIGGLPVGDGAVMTLEEIEALTDDYEEWQLDNEFFSRGMW